MKSDCKSLEVFDFKPEDELTELVDAKYVNKFKSPSAMDKYNFLENALLPVARGTNFQSKEMGNLPCVDVDAIHEGHNGDNGLSCVPLGSTGGDLATKQMSGLDDAFLFNSISDEQHPEFIPDKLKSGTFSTQLEPKASSPGAASPGNSQLNHAVQESPSSDESVDAIPDAHDSMSTSSSSTSSDILGDDVTFDGHGPLSDYCFGGQEMGNRNVAVVCPDYIVYRGRYHTESVLIFTSSCIELKGSAADGNQETFSIWELDDVVDIESQWSDRLRLAMVKISLLSKDAMQVIDGQGTSGIEEVQFAAVELNWYKMQEEIISLDVRYRAIWNDVLHSDVGGDEEALPGQNGPCISRERYIPNFDELFEEVVYPKGDSDAVTISRRDVELLQPDTFVNDTIIDFYIKYLKNGIQPEKRHRLHFFNSFFFRKLIDLDKDPSSAFESRAAFQRVRKWTRKVNLFEKDYIFIPVNFNYHWSLIVICHPGEVAKFQDEDTEKADKVPCILHMDSIKGNHTGLKDLVQSYLWEEWRERQKEASEDLSSKFFNLRFIPLELPQQQNSFDCGLFLLHYAERFLDAAPLNFSPFKITKFSNFLNEDWFPAAEPSLKRVHIQKLIHKILETENSPGTCSGNPCASISSHPQGNNEVETVVELISETCSPSKSCRRNISDKGIEMTLLPTASQCAGDSGLVLREFFEEGATAGSFLEGQYRTFDRMVSFSDFKGAISQLEEDVEGGGHFVYSEPNTTGFPSSSGGETLWNPGIDQTEHDEYDPSPETSNSVSDDSLEELGGEENNIVRENLCMEEKRDQRRSDCYLEVEEDENNIFEENLSIEDRIDQQRSPSPENVDCFTESIASDPVEMLNVADSQPSDHILNSNGNADRPRIPPTEHVECLTESLATVPCKMLVVADSQPSDHVLDSNGNSDHLISCPKILLRSPKDSHNECDDVQKNGDDAFADVSLVGNSSFSESDGPEVLQRNDGDPVLELDEMQPAKRLRLTPPSEGERTLKRSLSKDELL